MKVRTVRSSLVLVVLAGGLAFAQDQATVYHPGPGIQNPELVKRVNPKYTAQALRAKIEGEVEVEAVIKADGTVGDVRIVRSLDTAFGLDDSAVSAASQWVFKPGLRDGKPIPVVVRLLMQFRIKPEASQDVPQPIQSDDEFLKGVYRPGPGVVSPIVKTQAQAKYTSTAMRKKIEGQVLIDAVVGTDGTVSRARVQKSLDAVDGLDDNAIEAAKQFTFVPGTVQGQPVPVLVQVVIDFRLH